MRSAVRDHHLGADLSRQCRTKVISCTTQRAQKTNQGRVHFICTPWVPICLRLDSQQGGHFSLISIIITHHTASRGKFSIASQAIPLVATLHGNAWFTGEHRGSAARLLDIVMGMQVQYSWVSMPSIWWWCLVEYKCQQHKWTAADSE